MIEEDHRQFYADTPIWLWPVLWWSLLRFEAWLQRYWATHGLCDIAYGVTPYGTIKIRWIGDPYPTKPDPLRPSRAALIAFAEAIKPDIIISKPVRSALCAFARRVSAGHGLFGAPADAPRPLNLAPS